MSPLALVALLALATPETVPAATAATTAVTAAATAAEPLTVEVRGAEYAWEVRYPGGDGELGTADDPLHAGARRIHLPAGRAVRLELRSDDFVYLFEIPAWSLQEAAIPEIELGLDLGVRAAGVTTFRGGQMCGYAHASLDGELVFEAPPALERRLRALPAAGATTAPPGDPP